MVEPKIEQVFVKPKSLLDKKSLERKLYILRKFATHNIYHTYPQAKDHFYVLSFSYKTIIYKGQLTTYQLKPYFLDLQDELCTSAIALIHYRFSTNTVPKWKLAQPFRYIAHNGEINTITGNINWWRSKEKELVAAIFTPEELEKLKPICGESLSDSGNFDNVLEYIVLSGFSLPHALMMMIPEAWEEADRMKDEKRAFYEYHRTLSEPWDGPASICFTYGIVVGATLDRNGLRPSRYCLLDDSTLIVASEAGALPVDQSKVVLKGRLQPGKMLIADLDEHRVVGDEELKRIICERFPYRQWLNDHKINLKDLPLTSSVSYQQDEKTLLRNQHLHGYSKEDISVLMLPMMVDGQEPLGSMGIDTTLAVLSHHSQHLSNYFKQLFAQVTNPPIDPIRERSVMSIFAMFGGAPNHMNLTPERANFIHLESPILSNAELTKIRDISVGPFKSGVVNLVFKADGQAGRLKAAIDHICAVAEDMVRNGFTILILSDRNADAFQAPITSLLAVGAIHHHLVKEGLRG